MAALLLKLRTWWETADRTQKVVTIFGGALLAVIIGVTIMISGKPKFQVLYSELSPAEQGSVTAELTKLGIPYEHDQSGLIKVPEDKVAEAGAKLALAGKTPTTGRIGMPELDNFSITTPPNITDEKLNAAKQSQLSQTIEQMDGVSSASVIISPKKDSPFVENVDPAKASVLVKEDGSLTNEHVQAIRSMVQRSVEGLEPKNISIVSATRGVLYDGAEDQGPGGVAGNRAQQERAMARQKEQNLQTQLAAVLGADNVVVAVPVLEMNFDESQERITTHPVEEMPIVKETASETMSSGSTKQSRGAGSASNMADNAAPLSTDTNDNNKQAYDNKKTLEQFQPGEKIVNRTVAQGNVTKMSINVMVNDKVKDIAPIKKVVSQWLAPYQTDSDKAKNFTFEVTSLPFDQTARTEAKKAAETAGSAGKMQQIFSLLPIAALVFVGMMVVKAIGKTAKSTSVLVATSGGQIQAYATGEHGEALGTSALPATVDGDGEVLGTLPEHSDDPDVVFANDADNVEIAAIPSKLHIPLEQLKRLAKDRPDTVAMLLKSWILEER